MQKKCHFPVSAFLSFITGLTGQTYNGPTLYSKTGNNLFTMDIRTRKCPATCRNQYE